MTRVFDYHWLRHTSMALIASLLWVGVSSVEASIILPEESQLGGEWLFAGFEASSASSSASSSSSAPKPDERDRRERLLEAPGDHLSDLPDMTPSPTNTLSQAGSSGAGSAVLSDLVTPPQSALQASLQPEARVILPTGPPWYWFRPPRSELFSSASVALI